MEFSNIAAALGLTLIAGLSTGIGGLLSFFPFRDNRKFLSLSLGFSAGIMIYVSFVELLGQASHILTQEMGVKYGSLVTVLSFFCGIFFIGIIDRLVPEKENPHEIQNIHPKKVSDAVRPALNGDAKLMKIGLMTAVAIVIHNIPEGLATFASSVNNPGIGLVIAVAVAIHNIPEGIAVAIPIYYSSGSKIRAFLTSFLSGLAEFAGALLGLLLFAPFLQNNMLFGMIFAFVAGIMIFISFDELLPTAQEYGEHHISIYGLIGGMAVMALSLVLLS